MKLEGLTARQSQVAARVANGLTNREIGRELHLSRATVTAYLHAIYVARGLICLQDCRALLARWAREQQTNGNYQSEGNQGPGAGAQKVFPL